MDAGEQLAFVMAALRVVAPDVVEPADEIPATGEQLLRAAVRDHPIAASLLARLSEAQRADLGAIVEGMLRARALGAADARR